MSPKNEQQTLNEILIHVGETRKGIEGLEGNVKKIEHHLSELNHSAVRKDECTQRHVVVAQSINDIKDELKTDIHGVKDEVRQDLTEIKTDLRQVKSRTAQDHPAITPGMLAAGYEMEEGDEEATSQPKGLKYWLSIVGGFIGVVTFLGMVGIGLMTLGRKWEQMERTLEKSRQKDVVDRKRDEAAMRELKAAIRRLQPAPVYGPPAPAPEPKGGVRRPGRSRRARP